MTIAELLADEPRRQHEFPVARRQAYLAHAGVCPLPRRVQEAVAAYAAAGTLGDQEEAVPEGFLAATRQRAAQLLGAEPDEVALVGPTSLALSYVAAGLPAEAGDNVVIYPDDYPTNVYPWMSWARRGVEVRHVQAPDLGRLEPEQVLRLVDERTRLVALASCHFVAGYRLDVRTLGAELRRRGVRFCLDAIQTLGAFPTPLDGVDFLAADAHKWLLGPCAAGILWVRREAQRELAPTVFGWHNLRCPDFTALPALEFHAGARRYEAGSANLLGLVGLRAALDLLLEVGVEAIAAELRRKRAWLVPALERQGWTVLHAGAAPACTAGIVSFHRPGADIAAAHHRLGLAGVAASLRADRSGHRYVRLSPHFYNTDAELQRALEALKA
jgi:selenocysteine lyase/cysteine desulfurase